MGEQKREVVLELKGLKKVIIKMLCSSKKHLFIEDIFLEQSKWILFSY